MTEMKHAGADNTERKSVYETLRSINVSDHTEKKNGLTYLSWAWAWDTLMKYYPDTTVYICRNADGRFWFDDGRTGWVEVEVVIHDNGKDISRSELFPIMDYRNNSIPADKITSFSANTAIQRATTKAIARHGLGLYVYAGEDLPPEMAKAEAQEEKPADLLTIAKQEREKLAELYEQIGQDINDERTKNYIIAKAKVPTADIEVIAGTGDTEALERIIKVLKALQNATKKKIGERMISDQSETY